MNNLRIIALIMLVVAGIAFAVAPRVIGNTEDQASGTGTGLASMRTTDALCISMSRHARSPKDGKGPIITLAGAVHVGERRFYKTLQAFMDAHDVVLYEGVNPPGSGELPPDATPRQRVKRTEASMRLMAILIERHFAEHDAYPKSIDDLAQSLESHPRQMQWLNDVALDAWANPVTYELSDDGTFNITSLGADAKLGGSGPDADLQFSDQDPLSQSELGTAPGLQKRLAETFRLRFQLEEMDETKDNWRNADMDVDQLQRSMGLYEDGEGESFILFDLLDGSSGVAHMASAFLKLIENLPGAAPRGRLMIMEMLALADEDMLAAGMPGGEEIVDVLIGERNQVVIDRLKEVLREETKHERLGVIYGAGHMPDLERRLMDQLGYEPSGETTWHTAMRLPLDRVGISSQERLMIRATLLKQMQQLKSMQAE